MPEYIEREALDRALSEEASFKVLHGEQAVARGLILARDYVKEAPAADVETVRHGQWTQDGGFDEDNNVYTCSACGEPWTLDAGTPADNNMHYCPNCGAKMEDKPCG